MHEHLKPKYNNVWLAGGAMPARDFINLKLADEIRLSVMPVILGDGKLSGLKTRTVKMLWQDFIFTMKEQ